MNANLKRLATNFKESDFCIVSIVYELICTADVKRQGYTYTVI